MSEKFQKFILSMIGVLAMSILVSYLVFAWNEPGCNPPNCNVSQPINVGPQGQAKQGGLILNTGGASTGLIVQYGNVGIGTTDVTAKLTIQNLNNTQASFLIKQSGPGGSLFQKTIGGTNSDYGYSIRKTSDGGYVITGTTASFGAGGSDVFVIKLDSSGNLSWAKTIGGTSEDVGYSIQQTSDGGYVIAGYTWIFGAGNYDVFVIKLDSSGNLSWAKTIGGTSEDFGFSIQQTSDGGYVIAGYTLSFGAGVLDVFVIKLDSSGNLSWAKTIGGTSSDSSWSIQQTSDGGYVITGHTWSFGAGGRDVFVIKLNSSGNLSWAKTIGGPRDEYSYSIQQTSDGGYVITGETYSFGAGDYDVFVIKLDSSGNLSWAKTIGGTDTDSGSSIQQTSDGGYVITGHTWSFGAGVPDVFIIKLNSSGNLSWAKTIGGTDYDRGYSIQQTSDGGYVITGYTWSFGAGNGDVFVIKLDSSGNIPGCSSIGSPSPSVSSPSPTVGSPSPTVYSISPTVGSPSPTVSSQNPSTASQCSVTSDLCSLIVTPQGNVGIGTTAPGYKLEVVGSVGADGYYYRSDIKLKEDVSEIKDALEKILKLQGVNFTWKGSGEKSIGLIAQDVEKIFPELVKTDNSGMKSIDYGRLTAILIEGIKEQQKEIDLLKQEIENLKIQIKK